MMQGRVNQNCEVMLSIAVGHDDAPKLMVKALIDLGFSGFLSLPSSTIESLELPWIFSDSVTLGDGSEVIFQMYRAIPAHRLLFRSIQKASNTISIVIRSSRSSSRFTFALTDFPY
jgi:hypothetical protein